MPDPHPDCHPLPQRLAEQLSASKCFSNPGQLVAPAVKPQADKCTAEQALLMTQPEGADPLGKATLHSHLQHGKGAHRVLAAGEAGATTVDQAYRLDSWHS